MVVKEHNGGSGGRGRFAKHLARMYDGGLGDLPKDAARAAALYRQACDGGDGDACTKVRR